MSAVDDFVPHAARAEWADVSPIAQDDGAAPPAAINYSPAYADTMAYFRAVWSAGERSPRALALTEEVIGLNAAHYTAWQFRRECIGALKSDLAAELLLTSRVIADSSKNYQVWHHRRWIVTQLGAAAVPGELAITASVMGEDSKHYHAWSHRQWLLQHFDAEAVWEGEDAFTAAMIAADVRNNSAWSHRYLALTRGRPATRTQVRNAWAADPAAFNAAAPLGAFPLLAADRQAAEVSFALAQLRLASRNESVWSYMRGVLQLAALQRQVAEELAGAAASVPSESSAAPVVAPPPRLADGALPTAILLPAAHPLVALVTPVLARIMDDAEPLPVPFANELCADLLLGQALLSAASGGAAAAPVAAAGTGASAAAAAAAPSGGGVDADALVSRAVRLQTACASSDAVRAGYWEYRAAEAKAAWERVRGR